jgi:hypothetical protein
MPRRSVGMELSQRLEFVWAKRVNVNPCSRCRPLLAAHDRNVAAYPVDIGPTQGHKLAHSQTMAEAKGQHRLIAQSPAAPGSSLDEPGNLGLGEMLAKATLRILGYRAGDWWPHLTRRIRNSC